MLDYFYFSSSQVSVNRSVTPFWSISELKHVHITTGGRPLLRALCFRPASDTLLPRSHTIWLHLEGLLFTNWFKSENVLENWFSSVYPIFRSKHDVWRSKLKYDNLISFGMAASCNVVLFCPQSYPAASISKAKSFPPAEPEIIEPPLSHWCHHQCAALVASSLVILHCQYELLIIHDNKYTLTSYDWLTLVS